jgi:hypothetical protein
MPLSIRTLTCKQAATYEHLDYDVLFHMKPLPIGLVISLPNGRSPLRVHCSPRSSTHQRKQFPAFEHSCRFSVTFRIPPKKNVSGHDRSFSALPVQDLDALLPVLPTCPSFSDLPNLHCQRAWNPTSNRSRPSTLLLSDPIQESEDARIRPETSKFQAGRGPNAPPSNTNSASGETSLVPGFGTPDPA